MDGKNDIHVIDFLGRPYLGNERKFRTSSSQKHDHEGVAELFLDSIKSSLKS